ncbi:hypothetical protein [Luteitalea pratensis]|nr:hypothetical protein [Luteitalea pratensis]
MDLKVDGYIRIAAGLRSALAIPSIGGIRGIAALQGSCHVR